MRAIGKWVNWCGLVLAAGLVLAGCDDESAPAGATPTRRSTATVTVTVVPATPLPVAAPGPWQRTEERERCATFEVLRQAFAGDLHVHTKYSADAYIYGTRVGPHEAYAFARGAEISLSDEDEVQTRRARIERPLDFTAVTDHAEFFGEVDLCTTPGSLVYDDQLCALLRQAEDPSVRLPVTARWLFPAGVMNPPASHAFCDGEGVDCDAAAVSVWQQIQADAEEAYDRTAACTFTSFIGYEHTASPAGRHLHRNVIFRNEHVPDFAASQLETAAGGIPQGLWTAIEDECLNAGNGCDAVLIPHNSNLSGGEQWQDPADGSEARRRQALEPLVEIHQQKGNSECRFDRLAGAGVGTEDELCGFEQLLVPHELPGTPPVPVGAYPRRNLVRNTLKDGLVLEESIGANPFKLGFAGGTDTHNAAAGNTDERQWEGAQGNTDASAVRQIDDNLRDNPGGLTFVWAEENSRDALFAGLKRRETYATSGTRPQVRFFAGGLRDVRCDAADLVGRAYASGTPMGGDLGAVNGDASPRFAVLAFKDAGGNGAPSTDLQRVQIVKGWIDAGGEAKERVYDVAGGANAAAVDPTTCEPVGNGEATLCAVWTDPDFQRSERAFYYARVLENPTCRWSTLVCKRAGVDPFAPDCAAQAAAVDPRYADCCLAAGGDAFLSPLVQERAWTSPIWYRPESIAAVRGAITFGATAAADVLELEVTVGRLANGVAPSGTEISLTLGDDDAIYGVTVPAGLLRQTAPGHYTLDSANAEARGLRALALDVAPTGEAHLTLASQGRSLRSAQRAAHFVTLELRVGEERLTHSRLWHLDGDRLIVADE